MNLNEYVMKKALITLIALFLVNLCISAQIQRKFFDFTLGQTTRSEVENYLQKKKIVVVDERDDRIMVNNMRFAGTDWSTVAFSFFKGKIASVYFAYDDMNNSKKSVDSLWERLQKSLNKKYSDYYRERVSDDKKFYYQDNQTCLIFKYGSIEGTNAVILLYSDNQLFDEQTGEEEDEL